MVIKDKNSILNNLIFEQVPQDKCSFIKFFFNYRRSKIYLKTLVGFWGIIGVLVFIRLLDSTESFESTLFQVLFFVLLFVLAQYQEWIKCYLLENDEMLFGYMLGNKCFFVIKRKVSDICKFYNNKEFSQYVFVFNHGSIKYSLSYNPSNLRSEELSKIKKFAIIPIG